MQHRCQVLHFSCFAVWICSYWAALAVTVNIAANTLLPDGLGLSWCYQFYKILIFTTAQTSEIFLGKSNQIALLTIKGKKSSMIGSWKSFEISNLSLKHKLLQLLSISSWTSNLKKNFPERGRSQQHTLSLPPQIGQLYLRRDLAETKVSGLSPTLLACNTHHWNSIGRKVWSEKSPAKQIGVLN